MIATFFNKTKPNVTFSLFVLLAISCGLSSFLLYSEGIKVILEKGIKCFLLGAFLLYMLIFTVENHKLTLKNSYAGLFFVLIFSSFPIITDIDYPVFSIIALSVSFFKIYGLHNHIKTQKNIFDSGFWIGLATLLYFWNILFVILLFVSVLKNEKGNLKNTLSASIGFIAPLFLFFTYCFYFDRLPVFYNLFINVFHTFSFSPYFQYPIIISTILLLLLLLIALIIITPKASVISKKFSLIWTLLLTHFILSCFVIGWSLKKTTTFNILLLSFPLSIILTLLLQNTPKKLKNIILFILILTVVFQFLNSIEGV